MQAFHQPSIPDLGPGEISVTQRLGCGWALCYCRYRISKVTLLVIKTARWNKAAQGLELSRNIIYEMVSLVSTRAGRKLPWYL